MLCNGVIENTLHLKNWTLNEGRKLLDAPLPAMTPPTIPGLIPGGPGVTQLKIVF